MSDKHKGQQWKASHIDKRRQPELPPNYKCVYIQYFVCLLDLYRCLEEKLLEEVGTKDFDELRFSNNISVNDIFVSTFYLSLQIYFIFETDISISE